MVAYTFYEADNRVIRYAEALAKRGDHVDVIALKQEGQNSKSIINGVHVFRIQKRLINERRKSSYLFRILLFFLKSMAILMVKQLRSRYDLVHVHSVPDFLAFVAWLPKLMGTKIILDIHDLLPEFYASKFKTESDSLVCKLLRTIERISAAFADHVIAANHIWQKTLQSRSVKDSKCSVVLNVPERSAFSRRGRNRNDHKFIMLYPGTLNHHQGVDIAIRAFALIKDRAPEAEFHIYGEGSAKNFLRRLIAELGLENRVFLKGLVPLNEITAIMENADLGVVPKRKDSFGNEAFSTKIPEFMSLGVPVLVSDTKVDQYYFNDSIVKFFRGNDESDLANCMLLLIRDQELRHRLVQNAEEYIRKNNWDVKKAEYLELVDSLTGNRNGQSPASCKDIAGNFFSERE